MPTIYWKQLAGLSVVAFAISILSNQSLNAEQTADDLIETMRFNDSLLQQCLLEGKIQRKILPPPPQAKRYKVVVEGGTDIAKLVGHDQLFEMSLKYGNNSGVKLRDVPKEFLPLVKLIREDKITFVLDEEYKQKTITHRSYDYLLALHSGDVAFRLFGGSRKNDSLAYVATSIGNKKSSLEYFAGTWERVDYLSNSKINSLHEKALWYSFALGIGFGERTQSATLHGKSRGLFVLNAKISIWPGKIHDAKLLVDRNGIVRSADITCNTKLIKSECSSLIMTTEISTKISSSGKITIKTPRGRERNNMTVTLKNTQSNLSREAFVSACDLSPTDDAPLYYYPNGYGSQRARVDSSQDINN